MASTFTPNKYLEEPGTNDQVNTWGATLNTNYSRVDAAFGGTTSINLTGVSGNLDLTNAYPIPSSPPYSYIAPIINLSNSPTGNVVIRIPSGVGGIWSIYANFGGAFSVTVSSLGGGTSVVLEKGAIQTVFSDGTNIRLSTFGGRAVGVAANNLVALDATAKLPAVDGSQLTNLPGALPVSTLTGFAGSVEPSGWLFCDGRSLATTGTYAALFAAIAYSYGGAGASFNIPDLRGRALVGKDNMGTTGAANRVTTGGSGINGVVLGAAGGEQSHTLTIAEIPSHGHTYPWWSGSSGGGTGSGGGNNTGTTANTGGGGAHNNMQPTLISNWIIKY
jgi:microcystin-dependent protein